MGRLLMTGHEIRMGGKGWRFTSGVERSSLQSNRKRMTLLADGGANQQVSVQSEAKNLRLTKQFPRQLELAKGDTDQNPEPDLVVETQPRHENRLSIRGMIRDRSQARGQEHGPDHAQDQSLEEEIEVDLDHYLVTSPGSHHRPLRPEQVLVTKSPAAARSYFFSSYIMSVAHCEILKRVCTRIEVQQIQMA
jgi:hypothetical protein